MNPLSPWILVALLAVLVFAGSAVAADERRRMRQRQQFEAEIAALRPQPPHT